MPDAPPPAAEAAQQFDLVGQLPPDLTGEFFAHCDQLSAQHEASRRHRQVEQELEDSIATVLREKGLNIGSSIKVETNSVGEVWINGLIDKDDETQTKQLFPDAIITYDHSQPHKNFSISLERPTGPNQFESDVANLLEEKEREQARMLRDTRIIQHVRKAIEDLGFSLEFCRRYDELPNGIYINVTTSDLPDRVYELWADLEDLQLQGLQRQDGVDDKAVAQKREELASVHKGILEQLQSLLGQGVKCEEGSSGGYNITVPLTRP